MKRAGAYCLAVALAACGSDTDDRAPLDAAPSGASGGEPSEDEAPESTGPLASEAPALDGNGSGSDPAVSGEGQDPSAIGNVATPATGGGTPPAPSAGCGQPSALSSGEQSIEVAGAARTFVLDLPPTYDGTTAFPIVFAFHGATTSGQFFRSAFYGNLLSTMGDEAIVVHPDALGDPSAWNASVDVPFFDALLAELSTSLCVDAERVFATGHSSGGFFTNTLGCERGDVLRAIAPVSGGGPFTFGGNGCTGEVAVWLAHAENDEVVPFENGVASRDRWLDANACSEATLPAVPEPCVEYTGCSEGLPVRWCVYQDGHNFPDFGPEGIWGFFRGL